MYMNKYHFRPRCVPNSLLLCGEGSPFWQSLYILGDIMKIQVFLFAFDHLEHYAESVKSELMLTGTV